MQIEAEQMAFEERKAKERQQMVEQQNIAAQKIQASFRAFRVYKSYAPVLKEWRAKLKRKKDLQEEIEREYREKEERLRKRALEKKQKKEEEKKQQEEKEREEVAQRVKRLREYESQKELVRQRKEQLTSLEQKKREKDSLNGLFESKMKAKNTDKQLKIAEEQEMGKEDSKAEEILSRTLSENTDQDVEVTEKMQEIEILEEEGKTSKMESEGVATNTEEDLEITKKERKIEKMNEQEKDMSEELKAVFQKEQIKLTQEIILKEEKQDSLYHGNEEEKQTSGKTEFLNEKNNDNIVVKGVLYVEDSGSSIADYQTSSNTRMLDIKTVVPSEIMVVDEESGVQSNHISMTVQLGSGDSEQTDKSYAYENIKREPAKKKQGEMDDCWTKEEISIKPFKKPNIPYDSIEEKRLMWMKTCKSWSSIYRENKRKKIAERGKPRKCSAGSLPPLNVAMIIQAGPWNTLQQVKYAKFSTY